MKHLLAFSIVSILLLASCNTPPNVEEHQQKPEDVAKAFFEAMGKQEFEKAAALGTDHTKKQVKYFATELGMVKKEEQEEMMASMKLDFQSVNCADQEGSMICKICCGPDGGEAEAEVVQLQNKWFVEITLGEY